MDYLIIINAYVVLNVIIMIIICTVTIKKIVKLKMVL